MISPGMRSQRDRRAVGVDPGYFDGETQLTDDVLRAATGHALTGTDAQWAAWLELCRREGVFAGIGL